MANTKLFDEWTYQLTLPKPFSKKKAAQMKAVSKYNPAPSPHAALHAPTLRAMISYALLLQARDQGAFDDLLGASGRQGEHFLVAEYYSRSKEKTECTVYNRTTGKFYMTEIPADTGVATPYTMGSGCGTGTAMFFCLLPLLNEDEEFRRHFCLFQMELADGFKEVDKATETALILCDNVYQRIEGCSRLGKVGIPIDLPSSGNISMLPNVSIKNGTYAPQQDTLGIFRYITGDPDKQQTPQDTSGFAARYVLSHRTLSALEESMVPQLPEWYIVPKEAESICEHILATSSSAQPMRNFMLRGEAGTGKTMSVQAIAAGLHLPYLLMTCSANTEIGDLIGQFLPEAPPTLSSVLPNGFPKLSDIIMHPPSIYHELTGTYDPQKTEEDVLRVLVEKIASVQPARPSGPYVRYVDTPLVRAIRNGFVLELQETENIANPGVLVGLNALLDGCRELLLPTGERITRHPESIIVLTTNTDYAGTRPMNQSILSRMDLIFDMETPEEETLMRRAMNVTGFTDETEARRMTQVVRDIAEHCRRAMILDGSCGMRELKAWMLSTMTTGNPYESALSTIISSASSDADSRAELISSCLRLQYTESA